MIITATKTCAYWSCKREVTGINYLCTDHYEAYRDGAIDRCPECGHFKNAQYDLCLDCKNKQRVASRRAAPSTTNGNGKKPVSKVEHPKAWDKRDEGVERFYAYILKLDDAEFYAGHTRELRERLSEHRDDKTKSIAGRNPRLQYFEVLPSREAAATREAELKVLCKKNPREIRRMIIGFQDLLREVDSDW